MDRPGMVSPEEALRVLRNLQENFELLIGSTDSKVYLAYGRAIVALEKEIAMKPKQDSSRGRLINPPPCGPGLIPKMEDLKTWRSLDEA